MRRNSLHRRQENRHHDFNMDRFKTRLTAKSFVIFVAITQIIIRLLVTILQRNPHGDGDLLTFISIPLYAVMALIVGFEYILFRKIGPKIMNYSEIFDVVLLIFFTCEWMLAVWIGFSTLIGTDAHTVSVVSIFIWTGFQWRILFLLFLVQSWILLAIPPTLALCLTIGFILHFALSAPIFIVLRGGLQIIYIIIMIYFLDKIKWKEVLTNSQQERWIKINDFVLNNIPENIIILELDGAITFASDYCKDFMHKAHLSENPRDLFANIKELYQQLESEPSSPSNTSRNTDRLGTSHAFIDPSGENHPVEKIDDLQELIQNFKNIVKEKHLQERQFLIYNGKLKVEDHHTKSIEIKISYIQQHNKEYIVVNLRDTTQRDLLITLEDNNKYKDQLLASVSHELRAPLNGNINLVESAIQNPEVPEKIKQKLLTPALRSSKFLLHLINDILDMSQIKAHKLRLIFKPGKLQEVLNDTLQLVELQAKKKGLELCLNIDPDTPQNIFTDHVRLSQIILNLLNNAMKFTQKGSVTLSTFLHPDDPHCIKISVQDSGIGMTKEDIKKLFSDYTHIEFAERASINPTGVGLGLSIAYNLAKLLGPSGNKGIIVESVPGTGSTFSFFVENKEEQIQPQDLCPMNCSDNSHKVPDELQEMELKISPRFSKGFSINSLLQLNEKLISLADSEGLKCSCTKILVVDDNPFNIMAFETVLGSLHLKCDSVFDGQTAIDKILERQNTHCGEHCKPYSVVFMDQEMPGLTGSETVGEIKRLQMQNLVPSMKIIGCTAHGSPEEVEKFMKSGIDMCIQKPITAHELRQVLKGHELE